LIFKIRENLQNNGKYKFIELKKSAPSCSGDVGNKDARKKTLDVLADIDVVPVSQIGPEAVESLILRGIQPYKTPTFIVEALKNLASTVKNDLN
jgi:predicted Fe-Mo cluster-binding NifX family protein